MQTSVNLRFLFRHRLPCPSKSNPHSTPPTMPTQRPSTFSNPSPECSIYLCYYLPLLLLVDIHKLALCSQPYTVLRLRGRGSRELEKPLCAVPLSDEPVKPVELPYGWHIPTTRLERCSCLFEGPCAFSSCQYNDKESVQDQWELVTRHLALDSPNAQRLEIQPQSGIDERTCKWWNLGRRV
ncbi:hypothetical protein BKA70DRAFT_193267 [Coprinopsis sp. MPI-PUGE-AT-0042]|nr:hypothetical protein BKA70DRAFT_193267 [Coprinopsis sp. MPI-PUGE-AT-0042]